MELNLGQLPKLNAFEQYSLHDHVLDVAVYICVSIAVYVFSAAVVITCTGSSHQRGENAIGPLIGGEVVFSIQLSKTHCFGVQRTLLRGYRTKVSGGR